MRDNAWLFSEHHLAGGSSWCKRLQYKAVPVGKLRPRNIHTLQRWPGQRTCKSRVKIVFLTFTSGVAHRLVSTILSLSDRCVLPTLLSRLLEVRGSEEQCVTEPSTARTVYGVPAIPHTTEILDPGPREGNKNIFSVLCFLTPTPPSPHAPPSRE